MSYVKKTCSGKDPEEPRGKSSLSIQIYIFFLFQITSIKHLEIFTQVER